MTTRRPSLGPWMKLYVSALDTKAHYTDRQFRALIETWMMAVRQPVRGVFPNSSGLARRVGADEVDFMIEQGDLIVAPDGSVSVNRWSDYQSGVLSTERTRTHKAGGEPVDNSSGTVPEHVGNTPLVRARDALSPLPSREDVDTTNEEERPSASDDRDAADRFYELTLIRPWGKRSGSWLGELQEQHGLVNVTAALEVEHRENPNGRDLLSRVAARLERQAERVAKAKRSEPKPVDPVQAQLREALEARDRGEAPPPDPVADPEAVAAGRAAWAALRSTLPGRHETNGHGRRKGLVEPVGAVLGSVSGVPATGLSLTAGRGSETESAAVAPSGAYIGRASSSPGRETVRLDSRAEPGERVTDPPPRSSDGRSEKKRG